MHFSRRLSYIIGVGRDGEGMDGRVLFITDDYEYDSHKHFQIMCRYRVVAIGRTAIEQMSVSGRYIL